MHIQTHIMSGWCVANLAPLSARQRLCCMVATSIADLDGLSRIWGEEAYWNYHHKLCHNLTFAIGASTLLALWSAKPFARTLLLFLVYLGFAHLHLVLDYFGSGVGWPLYYLWPFSNDYILNRNAWEFYSWQNLSTAAALFVLTLLIAVQYGRTPLEYLMPHLDQELVAWLRHRSGYSAD